MRRLLWFRRDLRTRDNAVLSFDGDVLPIFIFDTNILSKLQADDRRVSYIFDCVLQLKKDLQAIGLELKIFYGEPIAIIQKLQELHGFDEVVASGDYEAYSKQRDKEVSHILHFRYLQETYIFKHNEVLKEDGSPYYVFTPYYKKALRVLEHKDISQVKRGEQKLIDEEFEGLYVLQALRFAKLAFTLENLGFQETNLTIIPLEIKLEALKKKLQNYAQERDFLDINATSNLSTELRFGVLGVRELLREISNLPNSEPFVRQLIFRDFYASLLFHLPQIEFENYKYKFNGIKDEAKYQLFCEAKTGVPIVDAGVRELLKTGLMHNRVRMVVASFFTKDLLLPWQWGEAFFAQHLLDYDKASNVLSWQWSAGTGVDPQPYFRVFNPYLQSKKFDKEGIYIKRYVPELNAVEAKSLHKEAYLFTNEIKGYPKPMLMHTEAAKIAVESFKKLL
ncbi:MAG: deoxyribodipyrimidine photo-lyase [Sulfurimonas sp.]|nr:deoxyribodipyrimidine photo-lyase [Sulfurimonas sp.]MBU3938174.1 DNA photolyase family protein [bacterium]MBU4023944.1 DNA photolyase family protein [bacterium]MBU4058307.1 DNA photolyase family protein [bacterium]MBU4109954.1 DNA photolyase family protein [bacterium]